MNCPKCGSGEIARYGKRVHFQCGSYGIGGTVDGSFYTHDHCADIREISDLRTERDALQARVTSQKCLLDQRWEMMRELEMECETKDVAKAVEYIKGLKARVKRLEEIGDQMAAWLNCERNLGNDTYTAHLWKQAKESKP